MFLRSSCSRSECGAPKGSDNSKRRRYKIARFSSNDSYIETDLSTSEDIDHRYCCHHQDFSHAEMLFSSSGEISPIPTDTHASNKSPASRNSKSRSSSVSLNYSHSNSNDSLPIPDIASVKRVDESDLTYRHAYSSTPIAGHHQNLVSSPFWAMVDTFQRRNIHALNPSMKSKLFRYVMRCYNFVPYWLKPSRPNAKAIISNLKMFGIKKIIVFWLLLLMFGLLCYACQSSNLLRKVIFLPINAVTLLSYVPPFSQFALFHTDQNNMPLTPDIQAMDPSTTIEREKVEQVPFNEDVLKVGVKDDANISKSESLVAKYIAHELELSQTVTNWRNENFFMREEISGIKKEFADLKTEFEALHKSLQVIVDLADKFGNLEVDSSQRSDALNESAEEENLRDSSAAYNRSYQTHLVTHAVTLLLKNLIDQNNTHQTPGSANFTSAEVQELMVAVKKHAKALETMEKQTKHLDAELRNSGILERKSYTTEDVENMIKKAISLYDADKTGETDYALESGGGKIVKHSKSYEEVKTAFGFSLWGNKDCSPRLAIQPSVQPGHCWAMQGTEGFLVVKLVHTIRPTGFVVEHAPASIVPSGNLSSAPKIFSVYGASSEDDVAGKLLGDYLYDINGDSLQVFPIQFEADVPLDFVRLKIRSNHGNSDYTCLYRFRVHGVRHIENSKE